MKSRLHYFLLIAATAAAVHGQNLQAVLSRMDVAGNQFKAMTSHMDRITHVDVINDDTPESGTIRITRSKAKEIRVSLDFSKPEPKQVAISERKVTAPTQPKACTTLSSTRNDRPQVTARKA